MMQADHKAEMVGMLKEIREEIEGWSIIRDKQPLVYMNRVNEVIDKKISELEGEE